MRERPLVPKVTRKTLAREVCTVLELPYHDLDRKPCLPVNAIFSTITKALRRGESVKVDGFGIFEVRTRAPTRCPVSWFYGVKTHTPYRTIIDLPEKQFVIFKPSKTLLRSLNEDSHVNT